MEKKNIPVKRAAGLHFSAIRVFSFHDQIMLRSNYRKYVIPPKAWTKKMPVFVPMLPDFELEMALLVTTGDS